MKKVGDVLIKNGKKVMIIKKGIANGTNKVVYMVSDNTMVFDEDLDGDKYNNNLTTPSGKKEEYEKEN